MTIAASVKEAAEAFRLPGAIIGIAPHGDGLIHNTYVVRATAPTGQKQFILQRINQRVFANPAALMENIERVVKHIQDKAAQAGRDTEREIPSLVCTRAGQTWFQANGEAWRVFQYVEGTMTVRRTASTDQAYQIASAFGRFLDNLADFPPQLLHDALPGYRDTQGYLAALWQIVEQDPLNRASDAREEIAFIEARVDQAMRLQRLQQSGQLQLRVIHGDTKLNNVLLDIESGNGVCAIDLDTVMPGLLLHDIGDCVREALVGVTEPRGPFTYQDLRVVEAIVSGFASTQSQPLLCLERSSIVDAISSITLELGTRFLCDYLAGDIYFRTAVPRENLRRAQQHFRLQERIEVSQEALQTSVCSCFGNI